MISAQNITVSIVWKALGHLVNTLLPQMTLVAQSVKVDALAKYFVKVEIVFY